jgi:hypothetical protein
LQHSPQSRPLDALAITMAVGLCLTWGFNQVAVKLAIHDIPPLMQAAVRSVIAAPCVAGYAWLRGVPLLKRDGTLWAGVAAGILFAAEFLLLYRGLLWTTATRTVLFLYFAPFLVALGSRWFIPSDRFSSFAMGRPGDVVYRHPHCLRPADAGGRSASNARRPDGHRRRRRLGSDDAGHQSERAQPRSSEKTMLYQLVVSVPILAVAAILFGEHIG